jgi:hypothetical protein
MYSDVKNGTIYKNCYFTVETLNNYMYVQNNGTLGDT